MALPSDEVLCIWNRIMKYQVDFSFPLELPMYLNLDSWRSADRVLDLGSGDGYYATRLATYFPNKHYTCIDLDERALESGKTQFADLTPDRLDFQFADALQFSGDFPIAVARLLVQHLETPEDLFLAAPKFLKPGGSLIVIDSDDRSRLFWPDELSRSIESFFRSFTDFQPGRRHSAIMPNVAEEYGFEIGPNGTSIIPSSIPTYKEIFRKSYHLFFEIVRQHYDMKFDYESLFNELEDWARSPQSYAQIGVSFCVYHHRTGDEDGRQ